MIETFLKTVTIWELLAALSVLILLVYLIVKVGPWLRKVVHFVDDLVGEPGRKGVPGRPGLMERMSSIEVSIEKVQKEVTDNHGSSLKDAVKGIRSSVDRTESTVMEIKDWQESHEDKSSSGFNDIETLKGQMRKLMEQRREGFA